MRAFKLRYWLTIGLAPVGAIAAPEAPLRVPSLLVQSDVVVIGRLTIGEHDLRAQSGANLRVDIVVKGSSVDPGQSISLSREAGLSAFPERYGIFFFRGSAGHLQRTRADVLDIVAAMPPYQLLPVPAEPLDILAAEISSIFALPLNVLEEPIFGLSTGVLTVPTDIRSQSRPGSANEFHPASKLRIAEDVYMQATSALRSIPYVNRRVYLSQIVDHAAPSIGRLWAYASMIEAGDWSHAEAELPYLLHPSEEARVTNLSLRIAFEHTQPPDNLAPLFAKMMSSSDSSIREAAIDRLTALHQVAPAPILAAAARDSDATVRHSAIAEICYRTGSCDSSKPERQDRPELIAPLLSRYESWTSTHDR